MLSSEDEHWRLVDLVAFERAGFSLVTDIANALGLDKPHGGWNAYTPGLDPEVEERLWRAWELSNAEQ